MYTSLFRLDVLDKSIYKNICQYIKVLRKNLNSLTGSLFLYVSRRFVLFWLLRLFLRF